jgi:hypothetical protein
MQTVAKESVAKIRSVNKSVKRLWRRKLSELFTYDSPSCHQVTTKMFTMAKTAVDAKERLYAEWLASEAFLHVSYGWSLACAGSFRKSSTAVLGDRAERWFFRQCQALGQRIGVDQRSSGGVRTISEAPRSKPRVRTQGVA